MLYHIWSSSTTWNKVLVYACLFSHFTYYLSCIFWHKHCLTKRSLAFFLTFCRSLTLPPPKEETLSRHSILGPNGLKGHWRPPIIDKGVWFFFICMFPFYFIWRFSWLLSLNVDDVDQVSKQHRSIPCWITEVIVYFKLLQCFSLFLAF